MHTPTRETNEQKLIRKKTRFWETKQTQKFSYTRETEPIQSGRNFAEFCFCSL